MTNNDLEKLIENFFDEYSFCSFTHDETEKILTHLDKKESKQKCLKTLQTSAHDIGRRKLEKDSGYKIALAFLEKKNLLVHDEKTASIAFQEVISFFNEFSFVPSVDFSLALLKNSHTFQNILHYVIPKKKIQEIRFPSFYNAYFIFCGKEINPESDITIEGPVTDSVHMYLREITNFPLLTKEEEKRYVSEMKKGSIVARNILVERNLRFVASIARHYIGRGLDFLDLIQEGNLGLMKALNHFDESKNCRLTTYAYDWIHQSITRAINNKSKNIRIPVHVWDEYTNLRKGITSFQNEFYREPSVKELAKYIGYSCEKVEELLQCQNETISLESSISKNDSETELKSIIPAQDNFEVEENYDAILLKKAIQNIFDTSNLEEREKNVLIDRFGLNGRAPMTLEETGKHFQLTRERVRQIESNAINKLRNPKYSRLLASFTEDEEKANQEILAFQKDKTNAVLRFEKTYSLKLEKNRLKRPVIEAESKIGRTYHIRTIYEMLKDYQKEEIDMILPLLNEKDHEYLKEAFGSDLEHPKRGENWHECHAKFYNTTLKKIKSKLEQQRKRNLYREEEMITLLKCFSFSSLSKFLSMKEILILCFYFGLGSKNTYSIEEIAKIFSYEKEEAQSILETAIEKFRKQKPREELETISLALYQEDLQKSLENLTYEELFYIFPYQDALCFSLYCGFGISKNFQPSEISKLLNMEEKQVENRIARAILILEKFKVKKSLDPYKLQL